MELWAPEIKFLSASTPRNSPKMDLMPVEEDLSTFFAKFFD